MSDRPDQQGAGGVPRRGEAAWKAAKDRVAERNTAARKAGMQQRQEQERRANDRRRAADVRESADLHARSGAR